MNLARHREVIPICLLSFVRTEAGQTQPYFLPTGPTIFRLTYSLYLYRCSHRIQIEPPLLSVISRLAKDYLNSQETESVLLLSLIWAFPSFGDWRRCMPCKHRMTEPDCLQTWSKMSVCAMMLGMKNQGISISFRSAKSILLMR